MIDSHDVAVRERGQLRISRNVGVVEQVELRADHTRVGDDARNDIGVATRSNRVRDHIVAARAAAEQSDGGVDGLRGTVVDGHIGERGKPAAGQSNIDVVIAAAQIDIGDRYATEIRRDGWRELAAVAELAQLDRAAHRVAERVVFAADDHKAHGIEDVVVVPPNHKVIALRAGGDLSIRLRHSAVRRVDR